MLNRAAKVTFIVLISLSAYATPKERESTTFQVITSNTRIHGSSSGNIFSYTDLMFTEINGKKIVYECVQRGDICPVMEAGKTCTADRQGAFIFILMNSPEGKKGLSAKFKQIGSW
jgi:hypothetical protein